MKIGIVPCGVAILLLALPPTSALHAQAKKPQQKPADIVQAKFDSVKLLDGREMSGTVTKDDYRGVTITLKGNKTETIKAEDVVEVYYKDETADYKAAMEAFRKNSYGDAIEKFKTALANKDKEKTKVRDWINSYAAYYTAKCMAIQGDKGAAVAYEKIRKDFPETRFLLPCYREEFDCHLKARDPAGAQRVLDELASSSKIADESVKTDMKIAIANLLFETKQWDKAQTEFTKLAAHPDLAVAAMAMEGVIRCLQQSGKTAEVESFCQSKAVSPNPGIALVASSELGSMQFRKAGSSAPALRAALNTLLNAVVKYLPPKGSPLSKYHAKALWHLGECYQELGKLSKIEDSQKRYRFWAIGAYGDLIAYHPAEPLAVEAQKKRKELMGIK